MSWEPIKVTDNDDALVTVLPDVTSPHIFSEGSHTVIYTASDPSRNTKICLFKVNVQGNIFSVKKYSDYFTSIKKQCQVDHIKLASILFNNVWEANNTKRNNRTQIEFKLKRKCYELCNSLLIGTASA